MSAWAAVGWGALAASSLVIGAAAALARRWRPRPIGVVLAFGAGALISAVSFDLAEEGAEAGGARWVGLGLALGAVAYFVADRAVDRMRSGRADAGGSLAVGAVLDGIPEQLVLGIGIAAGGGVSLGLLVAIFVSNLPEAIGSASEMRAAGTPAHTIARLWMAVAAVCALAAPAGFLIADAIPDAVARSGRVAGLVTTLGFAVAWALSLSSA